VGGTCSSPGGAIDQRGRVLRGGSYNNNNNDNNLRCANRNNNNPNNRNNNIGFRCVRTLQA
jgi:formylglycine-generating enzyme required for sulfatase activity